MSKKRKVISKKNLDETGKAHCQENVTNIYPQILKKDLPFESVFITKYLKELVDENRLKVSKPVSHKISYHDPCYLGRYLGDFDSARDILGLIPGLSLVEMSRNKEDGYCYGAGVGPK